MVRLCEERIKRLFAQIKRRLKFVQLVAELKTGSKVTDFDRDQARPSIQSVTAVLEAGRVTAAEARVRTEFLRRVPDGKSDCRHVSVLERTT